MKRSRFFLITVVALSLLCICMQGWQAWQVDVKTNAMLTQATVPLSQQPLEDERQYAENTLLCALSAGAYATHTYKWEGTIAGTPPVEGFTLDQLAGTAQTSLSLHPSSNGRSMVIRLHHLII